MNTTLSTLIAIAVAVFAIFIISRLRKNTRDKEDRTAFTILICIATIAFELLFSISIILPHKVKIIIEESSSSMEEIAEEIYPGLSTTELNKEKISMLLSKSKDLKKRVNQNKSVSLAIKTLGVNVFLDNLEEKSNELDSKIKSYSDQGLSFSLHNLLEQTKSSIDIIIKKAVSIAQLILCVLILLFYGILSLVARKA